MRVVYKIVLGLLLFNAFLTLFAPVFDAAVNTGLSDDAASSEEIEAYKPTGVSGIIGAIFSAENLAAWGGSVIVLAGGILVAIATKNYVYIGVALFVSIVIGLYIKMSSVISAIGLDHGNLYVTGIISIVGIAIGLIVVFDVIDMFAPAPAR